MIRRAYRLIPLPIKRVLNQVLYRGSDRYCPICRASFRKFLPAGQPLREDAQCQSCGALERHRLLWAYLESQNNFFKSQGMRMLHFAPEPFLESRFRNAIGPGYTTCDLFKPADLKIDITAIDIADNTFDIVYCSHVLEHVPEDRKAMRELFRITKPGGRAMIMVPVTVETTIEDITITDPEERNRLFGQHDHVRRYGLDVVERLREAGFEVSTIYAENFLSPEQRVKLGVASKASGEIFHCTKLQ